MPQYHVYGHIVGTKYLGLFEAKDEEEAVELGLSSEEAFISLCYQCDTIVVEIEGATAELSRDMKKGKK